MTSANGFKQNKKGYIMKTIVSAMAITAALALHAVPTVSNVKVEQDSRSHMVKVTYALSEPGIVTVDFQTNGVSIGEANFRNVAGDVNAVVRKGNGEIYWRPHAKDAWPDHVVSDGSFKAVVTAWSLGAPPEWLVADLRMTNVVNFYVSEAALPLPIDSSEYRKEFLLMRKITAAGIKWLMGAPAGEYGQETATSKDETQHFVMLTNDYYIGVFEFTQGQCNYVFGTSNSELCKPISNWPYNSVRGTEFSWPQDLHKVASGSKIGILRAHTGLEIDLPTEAEWEYACRAGTSTSLNSGKNIANKAGTDVNMDEVGWYYNNSVVGSQRTVHEVGLKQSNAWRLFDMHGNVRELCLDWFSAGDDYLATFGDGYKMGDIVTAPAGAKTGDKRVDRGAAHNLYSAGARSGARLSYGPTQSTSSFGFRVVCPANIAVAE